MVEEMNPWAELLLELEDRWVELERAQGRVIRHASVLPVADEEPEKPEVKPASDTRTKRGTKRV